MISICIWIFCGLECAALELLKYKLNTGPQKHEEKS